MRAPGASRRDLISSGFTLIEILLALAIGVLVLGGLTATLRTAVTLEGAAARENAEDRVARILLDRMGRELGSAFPAMPGETRVLEGRDGGLQDYLSVWTAAYGTPRRVEYAWDRSGLVRREIDLTNAREAVAIPIRGVSRLGLRYWNGTGWVEEWTERASPKAVAVQVMAGETLYGTIVAW